jgi:tetratricopeptide (TPR) repeat protein
MRRDEARIAARLLTPERCARLRDAFDVVLELQPERRDEWIVANIADEDDRAALAILLRAITDEGPLDRAPDERLRRLDDDVAASTEGLIGRRIGAFRLTRLLGQGGMATVFLGERDDGQFDQVAAIKLLRVGLYSPQEQRWFRREQQALATLSHPNIAHLIDGGISDAGIPYLVLEYVDGVPITTHATRHRLDRDARLRLFVTTCLAVAAAHRQLIVHRDLKPSNILVTDAGELKLLDFGIAKLLDDDDNDAATRSTRTPLTPEYAAPEQFDGRPITTATDVYALGIVLHELLLGQRPASNPTLRPGAERSPARGESTGNTTTLRGDLATILGKALDAEPERRYGSAIELAEDVQRFLESRPVRAHPPSRWYRARTFVRRHRGGVLLTMAFLVAILASSVLTAWQALVAKREAMRANLVRDFVVDVFESARTSLPRDQRPTPEALVEQATVRLATMPALDAATRADLLRTLGSVWLSLSKFEAADTALTEALALAEAHGDAGVAREIELARALGWQRAGRNTEAIAVLAAAIPVLERDDAPQLPFALSALAEALLDLGRADEALSASTRAVAATARLTAEDSLEHLATRLRHGALLSRMERHAEAVAVLDPALERWRASGGPDDDRYLSGLKALAASGLALSTLEDPEGMFRDLLALHRRLYSPPHDAIASALRDLAATIPVEERFDEAHALLDEALAMQRMVLAPDHLQQVMTLDLRGVLHAQRLEFEAAEAAYAEATSICMRAHLDNETCSRVRNNRGQNFYRQGKLVEAEREMRIALAERRERFGEDHKTVAISLSTLGNVLERAGRAEESVALQREALGIFERTGQRESSDFALIGRSLAQSQFLAGDPAAALETLRSALVLWQRRMPEGTRREFSMRVLESRILLALGQPAAARESGEAAIALGLEPALITSLERDVLSEATGRRDF